MFPAEEKEKGTRGGNLNETDGGIELGQLVDVGLGEEEDEEDEFVVLDGRLAVNSAEADADSDSSFGSDDELLMNESTGLLRGTGARQRGHGGNDNSGIGGTMDDDRGDIGERSR